jgi:hypothetical protein
MTVWMKRLTQIVNGRFTGKIKIDGHNAYGEQFHEEFNFHQGNESRRKKQQAKPVGWQAD